MLNSHPAKAAHLNPHNFSNMSCTNTWRQPLPTTQGRVTIQSTLSKDKNATHSSNEEGPLSRDLEKSREEPFENSLTQLCVTALLAELMAREVIFMEILGKDEQRCKEFNSYIHLVSRGSHLRSRCVVTSG